MQTHTLNSALMGGLALIPFSLCAPFIDPGTSLLVDQAPLHVPVCDVQPGGFDLFVCARLLTALKNLPYYQTQEIWAERTTGDGHLPAIFAYGDKSGQRQCFLSMDLYEPGTPRIATEKFSLQQEQTDLNDIYFECLKPKGTGGFNRLGQGGKVVAFLGPELASDSPYLKYFSGISANITDLRPLDLTPKVPTTDFASSS
ncbi:MAG: hypothetical protein Q9183_001370 [Haloplaca sp. 2 TL-2023]